MKKLTVLIAAVLLFSMIMGLMMNTTATAFNFQPRQDLPTNIKDIIIDNIIPPTEKPPIYKIGPLPLTRDVQTSPPPAITVITTKPVQPTKKPNTGSGQLMNNEGPLFLSFRSDLTEKMLMFTPMDLSEDGEYRFPLIGNASQVVGEAKVVVKSGMVTVTYLLVSGVKCERKNEFLTFFSDINSVTSVSTKKLQNKKLKFGTPYNIQKRLKSDAQVLLYINCPISYKSSLAGLTSFSFVDMDYLDRVTALLPLMD